MGRWKRKIKQDTPEELEVQLTVGATERSVMISLKIGKDHIVLPMTVAQARAISDDLITCANRVESIEV